jgi:hypothetical protein
MCIDLFLEALADFYRQRLIWNSSIELRVDPDRDGVEQPDTNSQVAMMPAPVARQTSQGHQPVVEAQ